MNNKENMDTGTSNLNNADTKTKVRIKTGLILFFLLNLNYGVWILLLGSSIYDGSPCGPYGPCFERVLAHPFRVLFLLSSIVLSALLIIFLYRAEKLFLTRKYRIWKIVVLSILLGGVALFSIFVSKSIYDSNVCNFGNDVECLAEKMVENNDISFCKIYKGSMGKCYIMAAEKGADISICDELNDLGRKSGAVGGSYECTAATAFHSNNPLLCNSAGDKSAYDINMCYLRLSDKYKWKDVSLCDNFIKGAMVNDSICTVGNKDSECEKFESTEVKRIECISSISINNNDKNLCKKLDLSQQKFCENRFEYHLYQKR